MDGWVFLGFEEDGGAVLSGDLECLVSEKVKCMGNF